jgi:hypothetical protein
MKKIFLLCLFLSVATICRAELYVIVDTATKEVVTVSEQNDTVVGAGQELKILKGKISDFTDENPTNYKLNGTKFIKNIDRIDKQERAMIEETEKQTEEAIMQKEIRAQAIKSLKDKGVELKNVNE